MEAKERVRNLRERAERNLRECILPFWRNYLTDEENGGFYGKVREDLTPDPESPKSVVLNCRLLWTFTRAYDVFAEEKDKKLAVRAFSYIRTYFWDRIYGGVYWMVTCKGEPSEPEKRLYGQAFLIYAMAEYYRVFGDEEALAMAMETFCLVNAHMKWENGGYRDSVARDWQKDDWVNVWVKNRTGAPKLLNSNMHFFEGILALEEVSGDSAVRESLKEELEFLLNVTMDPAWGHLKAAMGLDGRRLDGELNYGHDGECSYLMTRAALRLGEEGLIQKAFLTAKTLADHMAAEGFDNTDGGLCYVGDMNSGRRNRAKIWWVQAEGVTAFFNCYQITGEKKYLDLAVSVWDYIEKRMVNETTGDWYSVGKGDPQDRDYEKDVMELKEIFTNEEKAGKGKCPYHNSRVCFEIMERAREIKEEHYE